MKRRSIEMKTMKKLLCAVMALAIVLSLSAAALDCTYYNHQYSR